MQVGRARVQAVAAHGEVQAVRVNAGDGLVALAEGVTQFAPEGEGDGDDEANAEEDVVFAQGVGKGDAKHRQQKEPSAGATIGAGDKVRRFVPIAHAVAGTCRGGGGAPFFLHHCLLAVIATPGGEVEDGEDGERPKGGNA